MICKDNLNYIKIGFTTKPEFFGLIRNPEMQKYVQSVHLIEYHDDSTIRDLLKELIIHVEENPQPVLDDIYLWGKFYGVIDGKDYELNLDYPIKDYADYNSIDGIVWLNYTVIGRGGYGVSLTATIRLLMPSSEKGHERIPHVHIRQGDYRKQDPYSNTVRINLNDLSIMDNAEKKYKKLFRKRERELIERILTEHRELLISDYNAMIKGALPEVITVNFDSDTYKFGTAMFN